MSEDTTNKFTMHRDFVVKGFGHEVHFKKGEATHVPPPLHLEATRCGAVPLDPDSVGQVEGPTSRQPEIQGEERSVSITRAMDKLVAENLRFSFGADGLPTTKAIYRLTGLDIEQNERNDIWSKRMAKLVAETDPTSNSITKEETAEIAAKQEAAQDKEIEAAAEKEAAVEIEKTLEEKPAPKKKMTSKKAVSK